MIPGVSCMFIDPLTIQDSMIFLLPIFITITMVPKLGLFFSGVQFEKEILAGNERKSIPQRFHAKDILSFWMVIVIMKIVIIGIIFVAINVTSWPVTHILLLDVASFAYYEGIDFAFSIIDIVIFVSLGRSYHIEKSIRSKKKALPIVALIMSGVSISVAKGILPFLVLDSDYLNIAGLIFSDQIGFANVNFYSEPLLCDSIAQDLTGGHNGVIWVAVSFVIVMLLLTLYKLFNEYSVSRERSYQEDA
jgi:hypothetical protein